MPLFWVKFPANASLFNAFLIDIATFEVVPSEEINQEVFVLPDEEPYNVNWQQTRIDSTFCMLNLGTVLYVIVIYAILIISELIWRLLIKKCQRSEKYRIKLSKFLYWNAINTLAMEIYLDVGLSASLNIHTMKWLDNNPDLAVTNVFSYICMVYLAVYPVWMFIFYLAKFKSWRDEEFQQKYGSALDGTKYSN